MKLVLEFFTQQNKFPTEYRSIFMHFLKTCLDGANHGKYYTQYYQDTKTKDFTFAVFFDKPQFGKQCIELSSNRIKMIFSTSEELGGFVFYSSFLEKKNKIIALADGNSMVLKNVTKIIEPFVKNDKILVKMNAPLTIRSHSKENNKDYYYSITNEFFEQQAISVIKHQLENEGFKDNYLEKLKITPVNCKKVIVKHYKCKIEASLGTFLLEGNPIVLTYLLQAGIGSRKSEGFGMLELLTEDV